MGNIHNREQQQTEFVENDYVLLVITSCISRKLENMSSEVFEDINHVDRCSNLDTFCVAAPFLR